ncbi:ornithine cyclodeaminase family protein [Candidimonas sp. SYP-B2681]|uniref:ornithine cyclodeaminase family protein n=1 Tax=Candidimonas sp. SYP-B2681 TaxID=2497686 RepID=UPI000F899DA9|nr:ornithine cyclodeaminase family protein [Candidimonas sp. SYP-B2681]RTZ45435.1 ornithine cyclodeaminase family protein [Candidimonas sp. SYP-B2681]
MLHISDEMVNAVVTASDAQKVLHAAFLSYADGGASMQQRIRTEADGVKLSTLGAVIPDQGVAGAKIYTTIKGQFSFVILLFSAQDGRPLATFDAGALTRIRTAACTVLLAKKLARRSAKTMGLFGAGVQGTEHAVQLTREFGLEEILVCDPYAAPDTGHRLTSASGTKVRMAAADETAASADILVTASRSTTPLFSGELLRPGVFVAAIGSSLPTTRELDDVTMAKAKAIVIEWRQQSLVEAGDLILACPEAAVGEKVVELAHVLAGAHLCRQSEDDVFIYKSVGVGLEDIALAGHAYRQVANLQGLALP